MYENITDTKVIIDCGKKFNSDGKINAMALNLALLTASIAELNDDANNLITTQIRVIEHWWDGIGTWMA